MLILIFFACCLLTAKFAKILRKAHKDIFRVKLIKSVKNAKLCENKTLRLRVFARLKNLASLA